MGINKSIMVIKHKVRIFIRLQYIVYCLGNSGNGGIFQHQSLNIIITPQSYPAIAGKVALG